MKDLLKVVFSVFLIRNSIPALAAALLFVSLAVSTASAETIYGNFTLDNIYYTTGPYNYVGNTYSGTFTYDDGDLVDDGIANLTSFSIDFPLFSSVTLDKILTDALGIDYARFTSDGLEIWYNPILESPSWGNSFEFDGTSFRYGFTNTAQIIITYGGGTVNYPVPEPSTMILLGSGLLGLIGFRKRFLGPKCQRKEY